MINKDFLNGIANNKSDIIQILLDIMHNNNIPYCVIGGLAVNAYVEPVVSLDLDMVIAAKKIEKFKKAASKNFAVKSFSHSMNLYSTSSDLRIQIQTDAQYQTFVDRATEKEILGYTMKVASIEDILKGKIWAYSDEERRKSKRQKDLADIFRIIESYPHLTQMLPVEIRNKL